MLEKLSFCTVTQSRKTSLLLFDWSDLHLGTSSQSDYSVKTGFSERFSALVPLCVGCEIVLYTSRLSENDDPQYLSECYCVQSNSLSVVECAS